MLFVQAPKNFFGPVRLSIDDVFLENNLLFCRGIQPCRCLTAKTTCKKSQYSKDNTV